VDSDGVHSACELRVRSGQAVIPGTSLSASRVGLGTHALHRLVSRAARQDLLALAYELGVRYFDTAPSYGAGVAERALGRFARGRRSRLVLTTKFGIAPDRLAGAIPGWLYAAMAVRAVAGAVGTRRRFTRPPVRDFSAAAVRASVEKSLHSLGTDYVDILYLHEPTLQLLGDAQPLVRELEGLKTCGKVRYIGLAGQESECARVARAQPALAQILQLEVARDSDGLPVAQISRHAAVRFWEFAAPDRGTLRRERLAQIVTRLTAVTSGSILMISTNSAPELRQAVALIENPPFRQPTLRRLPARTEHAMHYVGPVTLEEQR